MFIGNTTLKMNEATMIEAVQEWLDKRVVSDRKNEVKSVKLGTDDAYSSSREFLIELREQKVG